MIRLPKLSLILAALACFTAVLPGQNSEVQEELEARRRKLAQKRKEGDGKIEPGDLREFSPEETLEARKRRGARGQCRFVAAMRPPKLLPGQSGTMLITAVLQGRSVLLAPSQVSMNPQPNGDMAQFGGLMARPAPLGSIHEAYRGQPVYENTAVFEVPVTITSKAKLGDKVAAAVDLEFDIYDGRTGQPVGRFIERVQTLVDIAPHLDPEVQGRTEREADPSEAAQPVQPLGEGAGDNVGNGADNGTSNAMSGTANAVDEPEQPVDPVPPSNAGEDDLPSTSTDEGGFPTLLVVGGGAFLLVIVLLLMRKK